MDPGRFQDAVQAIYAAVATLEEMFPGRHFTPDGHMVGSLGEAIASHYYGITLSPPSTPDHDGKVGDCLVQIKATQRHSISLSSKPDHLLVLRLLSDGTFVEEYNGPGEAVWALVSEKPRPKNGQYPVPLSRLRTLMKQVPETLRIKQVISPQS